MFAQKRARVTPYTPVGDGLPGTVPMEGVGDGGGTSSSSSLSSSRLATLRNGDGSSSTGAAAAPYLVPETVQTSPPQARDMELGGLPAVYDEQAWANGELLRAAATTEEYVPISLARERLQEAVDDMEVMRTDHLAVVMEVRGHYETILRDMNRVFSEHSEGARDAYNSNVQKLQARLTAAGAEAETLRQQLAAAEAAGAWPGAAAVVPVAATVTAVAGTPGERAREMEAQLARLQADNDAKSAQLRELAAGEGEAGGGAPLFPPAVAAAQPRMGRAVGRAVLALARAQVASQVQKTALAQARVEGAQKHVQAQQQQLSAAESTAREELEEAREVVAQVAPTEAPDPAAAGAGAGAGAAAAGAQMEGARQKLQQVQAELVTVRAHDAELEGQRLALEAERASMEAALRQAEAAAQAVSGAFRSCVRSVLAEIRLCHACSCQEILRTETPRQATQSEGGLRAELARLQVSRSCPVLEMSPASC
jgi:hypothetical protein